MKHTLLRRAAAGGIVSIATFAGLSVPAAAFSINASTMGPNSPILINTNGYSWSGSYDKKHDNKHHVVYKHDDKKDTNKHYKNWGTGYASWNWWNKNSHDAHVFMPHQYKWYAQTTSNHDDKDHDRNKTACTYHDSYKQNDNKKDYPSYHHSQPSHYQMSQRSNTTVTNNNRVSANNTNYQRATTGNATAYNNTHVGNVSTGNAYNENATSFDVSASNSTPTPTTMSMGGHSGSGYTNTHGPNSGISLNHSSSTNTRITNSNTVTLTNRNSQQATTGSATARNNTHVGDVSTGDAYNSNVTSFVVSLTNGS